MGFSKALGGAKTADAVAACISSMTQTLPAPQPIWGPTGVLGGGKFAMERRAQSKAAQAENTTSMHAQTLG